MKQFFFFLACTFCLIQFAPGQQSSLYFAAYPALTPDGREVVFSYDGDLWAASIDGNSSSRLTAMQGSAIRPRISPDGKWIAFSNSQFGNHDIYVMPAQGGDIKRISLSQ